MVIASLGVVVAGGNPISRVVTLLKDLASEIETDGTTEQGLYNTYACWCEDETARLTKEINTNRDDIETQSSSIKQLSGEIGTLTVDIAQLEKDIAANKKSQEEATALRKKEHDEYALKNRDDSLAIGAMSKAIKILKSAHEKINENGENAAVIAVKTNIRRAMKFMNKEQVGDQNYEAVLKFVEAPTNRAFLQSSNNPFGDYSPASTQILGILRSMLDSFLSDVQADNREESLAQKSFEDLIDTKRAELASLESTLENKTLTHSKKSAEKTKTKKERVETQDLLKQNEESFAVTKAGCQEKADQWAERTRLRTEELAGIKQAVKILEDGKETFEDAYDTAPATKFVQFSKKNVGYHKALNQIKAMATKKHSLGLATLAVSLKTANTREAFAKVLKAIDEMIQTLQDEEKSDDEAKRQCNKENRAKKEEITQLEEEIAQAKAKKKAAETKSLELEKKIGSAEGEKTTTEGSLKEATDAFERDDAEFKAQRTAELASVQLLKDAMKKVSAFQKNNKIAFTQTKEAPGTWDSEYGGKKSETTGILAIFEMLIEDVEKQIEEGAGDQAEDTSNYRTVAKNFRAKILMLKQEIATLSKEKAEADAEAQEKGEKEEATTGQKKDAEDAKSTLVKNCQWVKTHYDIRKSERKATIEGLQDAKGYLEHESTA